MRRIENDDRGASMVFIAICLVFLIGFAGLAVDVGALYAERTELQKGAEAAVLAIAEDCGRGVSPCDIPTATATAEDYIDDNARDLAGAVDSLDLDLAAQEVTVIDRTERTDGGGVFLPFFAQVIGFTGSTVRSQASAAWGAPGSLATLPIAISECAYLDYGPATSWPQWEEPFVIPSSPPIYFGFHGDTTETAACSHDNPSGQDLPGGFGWLSTDGACETETDSGGWAPGHTGVDEPDDCYAAIFKAMIGTVVPLPFFDEMTGTGSSAQFHIAGYAPFYVTGYDLHPGGGPNWEEPSRYDGLSMCLDWEVLSTDPTDPANRVEKHAEDLVCIEGYFVDGYTWPDGDPDPDAEYRGILIVKLTG